MRDPARIPRIVAKLERLWLMNPDLRLGQLVSDILGSGPYNVYYTEDYDWERFLDALVGKEDP